MPCFTPGTSIATPRGEHLVEELALGDQIITRENGIQQIRWIGRISLGAKELAANPHLKPVLIQKGALGNGLPERDMLVSPNHRILVANDRTALYFEDEEALVAAKHLVNNLGVHRMDTMATSYVHFLFDRHEMVLSNGAWTESFQPEDQSLKGVGNSQRTEIFQLFPELKIRHGQGDYDTPRNRRKKHDVRLVTH